MSPVLKKIAELMVALRRPAFRDSAEFWEQRYKSGGTSGCGSYGALADFKAQVLNDFVARSGVTSVVEFGCGDGNQLSLGRYPSYVGLDISPSAIERCLKRFAGDKTKSFMTIPRDATSSQWSAPRADLALSLDVVFHLVEDSIFELYMIRLFAAATRFAIVYSTDFDETSSEPHVRHRRFTPWVEEHCPDWRLLETVKSPIQFAPTDKDNRVCTFYMYGNERSAPNT